MSNDISVRNKEQILTAISRRLVLDVMKATADAAKAHGGDLAKDLSTHFIACYIGAIAFSTLSFKPDKKLSEKQLYDIVSANFLDLKTKIQESVAAGFTGAMRTHTEKEIEYYCLIKPIPPVANSKPC